MMHRANGEYAGPALEAPAVDPLRDARGRAGYEALCRVRGCATGQWPEIHPGTAEEYRIVADAVIAFEAQRRDVPTGPRVCYGVEIVQRDANSVPRYVGAGLYQCVRSIDNALKFTGRADAEAWLACQEELIPPDLMPECRVVAFQDAREV